MTSTAGFEATIMKFEISALMLMKSVLFYFDVRGSSARLSANSSIFGTLGGHITAFQGD